MIKPIRNISLNIKTLLCVAFLPLNLLSQDFGNTLEFDGSDDYVFIGNDTSLQVDQFTLTAWVHPYSYSEPLPNEQRMEIFEKAGEYWMNISTNGGYQRDKGEVRVGGIFEGQWHFLDSEFVVPLNEWTHVACTYDYDSLKLYINGKLDVAKAIPENHTDKLLTDNMLALGCKCVEGEFSPIEAQFHGMLDEMSIWNTALSENEILDLKNKGIEKSHPKWAELRAYYKLDEDKIGEHLGAVRDEIGLNDGNNYGATWVPTSILLESSIHVVANNTSLHQNYPNPFQSLTHIAFTIDKAENVQLDIYNVAGRHIQNLANKQFQRGEYVLNWNASGLPEGIYLYKLTMDGYSEIKKCIIANEED